MSSPLLPSPSQVASDGLRRTVAWGNSVTIVGGLPVATYPGERHSHDDQMCEASPVNLSDPLLVQWRKNPANPLRRDMLPSTTGPLGCTSSWREGDNWTTTIESKTDGRRSGPRIGFWTSANYVNWSFVGFLNCPICELCVKSCASFYPAPDGPADSWVYGINSGGCNLMSGGMVTNGSIRSNYFASTEVLDGAVVQVPKQTDSHSLAALNQINGFDAHGE